MPSAGLACEALTQKAAHPGVQFGMNCRPGPHRVHTHAAHDINRDVVHVAAVY